MHNTRLGWMKTEEKKNDKTLMVCFVCSKKKLTKVLNLN